MVLACNVSPNLIPENGGTEFIVLQVQNNGIDAIFLSDVAINNVIHIMGFFYIWHSIRCFSK